MAVFAQGWPEFAREMVDLLFFVQGFGTGPEICLVI